MISRNQIYYSEFNLFGRLGIVVLIAAIIFVNFLLFGHFADKEISEIGKVLGSQLFAALAGVLIFIAWAFLAVFISFCVWVVTSKWMFNPIFESPKKLGEFIIKFFLGDWNRAELFRR